MVLGESCLIGLAGGILGVGIGCLFLQVLNGALPQQFPLTIYELVGGWLVQLLMLAAAIGAGSGIIPAFGAARLSVVNGLRQVV
jgi:ABC-type antimicrobial peptide transport system permease subunit